MHLSIFQGSEASRLVLEVVRIKFNYYWFKGALISQKTGVWG